MRNIGSLIGTTAMVAAAIGLTVGLAPASAAPQQSPGVSLARVEVDPSNHANYRLRIEGTIPMSEGVARDRLNNLAAGGGMDYVVYADDPGENDAPIGFPHGFPGAPGPAGGTLVASSVGLQFTRQISVPRGDLNEDFCFSSGLRDCETDEVYVKVRFVQGNGASPLSVSTNAVSGHY